LNRGSGDYHERERTPPGPDAPSRGPFVGRPEALVRWPWLRDVPWAEVAARFPVGIPRGWAERAGTEPDDPLLRTALPDARELLLDPGDLADPVGDAARSPLPWVVRKHDDRVLLLLTKRCHLYCRYCFRRNHQPGDAEDPSPAEWSAMLDYAANSGAREVILSGGDPLAVSDARLFQAIDALRDRVPVIRIHTRAPVTYPQRVTEALVAGLRARAPVWVLIHANHARELEGAVPEALRSLVDSGVPVLNQAVLLAGVNDDVDVLVALSERLLALRVFPYYLHHPDAAGGNAHFRVTPERGLALHEALRARVSGIGLPAYVIDSPDGAGKMAVDAWVGAGGARSAG
jgi:lysine 2,3-aminomutase